MAHALDALALVALGDVGADEREGDGVEFAVEHGLDVVNELARDGVLIGGEAEIKCGHGPLDGGPVKGGEACADAEGAATEVGGGGREDGRGGVVFLDEVFEREQVGPGGGEDQATAGGGAGAVGKCGGDGCGGDRLEVPAVIAGCGILEKRPGADGGGEAAGGVFTGAACGVGGAEGGPVQTEVRADTGIGRDAEIVREEEGV